MSTQDDLKRAVAAQAVDYCLSRIGPDSVLGIGTGSTVDFFIEALAAHQGRFARAVSSSERSTRRLQAASIRVADLNEVSDMALYVDGADEINADLAMIKGGGGALTREKIVAAVARQFVCIVDASKVVTRLGDFPLPVEVIPMAREAIMRRLQTLGGRPQWREAVVTDNGGHILDVHGLALDTLQARQLETEITTWPGVITCGLFALRPADLAFVGNEHGVQTLVASKA